MTSNLHKACMFGHLEGVFLWIEVGQNIETADEYGRTPLFIASQYGHVNVVEILIRKGAQIETTDIDGNTPLHLASSNGHLQIVKKLIRRGARVEIANNNGITPLFIASENGHLEVVKKLIRRGARVEIANNNGITPLFLASHNGHLKVIRELIKEGAQIETANNERITPLSIACYNGLLDVVKELITLGANLETATNEGWTPLLIASQNGHVDVVKELIERGAQVEIANKYGYTSILIASECGHLYVVKELIRNGANIETANNDGWTSLHAASHQNHLDVVKELIKHGALMNTTSNLGSTSLFIASEEGHLNVVKELIKNCAKIETANTLGTTPLHIASQFGKLDVVKELIQQGAQARSANNFGITPLHLASLNGHLEVVKELARQYANLEITCNDGCSSPLYVASQDGHLDVVKELIRLGAQVDTVNNDGWTPLHVASQNNHVDVVIELIRQGAKVESTSKNGETPLYIASYMGHLDMVIELTRLGAQIETTTNHGWTPLHISSHMNHLDVVKELIKQEAQIQTANNNGDTPLHVASHSGYLDVVKELIKQCVKEETDLNNQNENQLNKNNAYLNAYLNAINSDEWTALMKAVHNKHEKIVDFLLSLGASVSVKNKFGMTALMLSADHKQLTIASKLLEKEANLDDSSTKGWTSLMIAAENGNDKMVQEFIEKKANVNLRNKFGNTALMLASRNDHKKVVRLLKENNAIEDEIVGGSGKLLSIKETNNNTPNTNKSEQEVIWDIVRLSKKGEIENINKVLSTYDNDLKDIILSFSLKTIQEYNIPIAITNDLNKLLLEQRITYKYIHVDKSNKSLDIKPINKEIHLDTILEWNKPVDLILLYHVKNVIFYINDLMFDFKLKKILPWKKMMFYFQQYNHFFTTEYDLNSLNIRYIRTNSLKRFVQLIKNVISQTNMKQLKEDLDFQNTVKHLNDIYDNIRDIYILIRIDEYIQLWKNECNSERHYWSTLRLLQVIGESFKTTHASPNLSEQLQERIKPFFIDGDLIKVRDYLGHLTGIPELDATDVSNIIKDTENIVSIFQQVKNAYLKNRFLIELKVPPLLELQYFRKEIETQLTFLPPTFDVEYARPCFKYTDLSDRIITNYDDCLLILKKSLESNNKLELEFILLVVLNHLKEKKQSLNINRTWFRAKYPTLTGAQLRNHLAHGDTIVQLLNIDEEMAVRDTAKLLTENLPTIFTEKPTKRPTNDEEKKFILEDLKILEEKQSLFDLITEGDLNKLMEHLTTFDENIQEVWIHWCNHIRENILQQAAQNKRDNLELFRFIFDKHPSLFYIEYKIGRGIDDLASRSKNTAILEYVNQLIEEYSLAPLFYKHN